MIDLSSFDIIFYLEEIGISYSTSGKNISQNWIGINCPFCDDQSNHCGINIHSKVYSCFRCGSKGNVTKLIMALENKNVSGAMNTIKQFTKKDKYGNRTTRITKIANVGMVDSLITETTTELEESGRGYLERRGFDAILLEKIF